MSEFTAHSLLRTSIVEIADVAWLGSVPRPSSEECANATQMVFPYRGVRKTSAGCRGAAGPAQWRGIGGTRYDYVLSGPP